MHPRQLKSFLAVARHGNLTRAASESSSRVTSSTAVFRLA